MIFKLIQNILIKNLVLIILLLGIFFHTQIVFALTQTPKQTEQTVIEYLRLNVPKTYKRAWLKSEENSWGPWLKKQKGFLGRQLLWDPENQEAVLLITWASRSDWKNIPQSEIDRVQEIFEDFAMKSTGNKLNNPFPIQSQGELLPQ